MNINEQGNQEGNSAMEGGSVAWEPAETCPLREEGRKALRNHCLVWMVNHPPLSGSRLTHQSDPFRHLQVTRRTFRCNRTLNRFGFTTARVSSRGQYCATRPSQEPQDLCTRLASGRRFLVGFSLHAGGSDGKESAHDAGDPGSIPGLGRALEKKKATHSYTHAWRIPWTEEPGRLQSMGSQESDTTEWLNIT